MTVSDTKASATVELTMNEVTNIRVSILSRLSRLALDPDQAYAKPKREELIRLMEKLYRVRQELRGSDWNTEL